MTLPERLQGLRQHRSRSFSAAFSCDTGLWSTVSTRVQVLVSDGTILYAKRRAAGGGSGYELDVRSPSSLSTSIADPESRHGRLSVELSPSETHIEAVDVSQDLLIISQAADDTWFVRCPS